MNDTTYKNYLVDLAPLLLERAFGAKEAKNAATPGSAGHDFEAGRLMAFNEVISIMQQQAAGFNIPLSILKLERVDPDRDLT